MDKEEVTEDLNQEDVQRQNEALAQQAFKKDIADSDLTLIGDKSTICQVVQLLAYIRHAIQNNLQTEIKVKVGHKIANGTFMFAVNGLEIPDYRTQDEIEIN